jgi:hypothetical protein
MSRVCTITLVCEGWEDKRLVRAFLDKAIQARVNARPNLMGCGYEWVIKEFVQEVRNLGRFSEGRGVIGVIDEDGLGSDRRNHINRLLHDQALPDIEASKGRCLLLAIRNIETWAYWLKANRLNQSIEVDEISNYKNAAPDGVEKLKTTDWRDAGNHLHQLDHTNMPGTCPAGLVLGLQELRAFVQAVRR